MQKTITLAKPRPIIARFVKYKNRNDVVQQCFRVICYSSREINGTLGLSTQDNVHVSSKVVIAINLH